jgi:hypothetical protein
MKARGLDRTHAEQYRVLLKLIKMRLKYDAEGICPLASSASRPALAKCDLKPQCQLICMAGSVTRALSKLGSRFGKWHALPAASGAAARIGFTCIALDFGLLARS